MRRSLFASAYVFVGFAVFALCLLVTTIAFGIVYALSYLIPIGRKAREGIMYFCMILNCRVICGILMMKIDFEGFENLRKGSSRICFIANHTSMLDIVAALLALYPMRIGFIAKRSLFRIPLFRLYLRVTKSVPIDFSSMRSNISAIRQGVHNICDGMPMLIFPEGSRSKDGVVGAFKRGSFKMAERSGAIAIPLAISGLRRHVEGRKRLFVSGKGRIVALDPIDFSALDQNGAAAAAKRIENAIRNEVGHDA